MADENLAAAATANFVVHASFASSRRPEARVHVGSDLVVADAGFEVDTFNIVCAARLHTRDVAETARRVAAGFGGRPFSWWVAPGDEPGDLGSRLEAGGLAATESALAMAAPLDAGLLGSITTPPGLRVERVYSDARLAAFARVNAGNWDPLDPAVEAFFGRSAADLLGPDSPQRFHLALADAGGGGGRGPGADSRRRSGWRLQPVDAGRAPRPRHRKRAAGPFPERGTFGPGRPRVPSGRSVWSRALPKARFRGLRRHHRLHAAASP